MQKNEVKNKMELRKNFNLERQQLQQFHRQQLEERYLHEQRIHELRKQQKQQMEMQIREQQEHDLAAQKLAHKLQQQVKEIQTDLDNLCENDLDDGYLGSFLSKGLKTNQLVVNTDEKTLRPIARLKEPRDLFALPKDKDNDCSQQAPRWPIECQVLSERVIHIPYVPAQPEPFNEPTGNELKPRPVGEENGIVVFNYNPISAVNYPDQDNNSGDLDTVPYESIEHSINAQHYNILKSVLDEPKTFGTVKTFNDAGDADDDDDDDDEDDENQKGQHELNKVPATTKFKSTSIKEQKMLLQQRHKQKFQMNKKPLTYAVKSNKTKLAHLSAKQQLLKSTAQAVADAAATTPTPIVKQNKLVAVKVLWSRSNDSDTTISPPENKQFENMEIAGYPNIAHAPVRLSPKQMSRLEQQKPPVHIYATSSAEDTSAMGTGGNNKQRIRRITVSSSGSSDSSDSTTDSSEGGNECGLDSSSQHSLVANLVVPIYDPLANNTETKQLPTYQFIKKKQEQQHQQHQQQEQPQQQPAQPEQHATKNKLLDDMDRNLNYYVQIARAGDFGDDVLDGSIGAGGGYSVNVIYPPQPPLSPPSATNETKTSHASSESNNNSSSSNNEFSDLNNNANNMNNSSSDNNNQSNMSLPQFSRSSVGGAKFLTNCHPYDPKEYDGLEFESRFECGNLAKAVQITRTYYELYLRPDLYTSRSKQWFYFRVKRTRKDLVYRFSIVNLVKSDSLYNEGMRPVMYSTIDANKNQIGWRRCGENIVYYRNDDGSTEDCDDDNCSYTLTFNIEFTHDDDTVFFAHSYPYTYSDLQDYLMDIQKHPVKSQFCKLRLLCRTLAGNNVYYLTVTAPAANEEAMKRKKSIVVSARVHPSETPASWMMKGLMDFITGESSVAKKLRHRFIFKLIPMLNPDGVIVGNTRNSLTGKDLNRQYRTVIRETYPSIWYTKAMIKRLIDECGVTMYCDMHAHSRKHNIFIYGCENKRNPEKKLTEQVFPLMLHKNVADRFSFESCKFKIQRSKEGTGRIVVWMLGITNSYTIEASFGGSTLGGRKGTHFTPQDYEHMGKAFCETLLDYCDENPNKVKRNEKIFKQIKKIRKREKREQKALKLKKMAEQERLRLKIIERLLKEGSSAEEPLNIPLSDYSSDEGNCSSSSDNEGKESITLTDLEGPCCRAPPCSPEAEVQLRRFRYKRMRKIMQRLDQVYFQPLLHKKFEILLKGQKIRQKSTKIVRKKIKPTFKEAIAKIQPNTIPQTSSPANVNGNANTNSTNTNINNKNTRSNPQKINVKQQLNQTTTETQQQVPNRANNQLYMQNSSSQFGLKSSATTISTNSHTALPSSNFSETETSNEVSRNPNKQCAPDNDIIKRKKRIRLEKVLRTWLLQKNIVITKKNKRRRKNVKRRPLGKLNRKQCERLPLDMPTTDPGSDLQFSTDEEFYFARSNQTSYSTVPRMRRTVLLESELQRRYIHEIGDASILSNKQVRMPPELIVTSPGNTKSSYNQQYSTPKPNTVLNTTNGVVLASFPIERTHGGGVSDGSGEQTQRTSSWHNLNAINRLAKLKLTQPQYNTNEDLQLRLSLKKKLWNGQATTDSIKPASGVERSSRPTSWYQSLISKNATLAAKNRSFLPSNEAKRTDSDAALLSACSEKLLLWQQNEKSGESFRKYTSNTVSSTIRERKNRTQGAETIELGQDESTLRIFRQIIRTQQADLNDMPKLSHIPLGIKAEKSANKRSIPLTKLADTTQLVTRLSKTKQIRAKTSSNTRIRKSSTSLNTINSQQKMNGTGANKFKTGGIVVTAVQPTAKKTKKLKAIVTHTKSQLPNNSVDSGIAAVALPALGDKNSLLSIREKQAGGDVKTVVDSKTILRKLKTKLKKKTNGAPNPLLPATTTRVVDIADTFIAATTNNTTSSSAPVTRTLQPYSILRRSGPINTINLLRKQN